MSVVCRCPATGQLALALAIHRILLGDGLAERGVCVRRDGGSRAFTTACRGADSSLRRFGNHTRLVRPIVTPTFFLELPHDLRLPPRASLVLLEERGPGWDEWDDAAVARLTGAPPELFRGGAVPGTRLVFRRSKRRATLPLQAADEAFSDWVEPLLSPVEVVQRRERVGQAIERGFEAMTTVVALSRFIPDEDGHWLTDEARLAAVFRAALADLNEYIVAQGTILADWRYSPVSPGDLPAILPCAAVRVAELGGGAESNVVGLPIHDRFPSVNAGRLVDERWAIAAGDLVSAGRRGDQPFWPLLQLLHEVTGYRATGEYVSAVVTLGTAAEVLVATVVREAGLLRGELATDLRRLLDQPALKVTIHVFGGGLGARRALVSLGRLALRGPTGFRLSAR